MSTVKYGLEINRSVWTPNRDCLAELETSASGNIIMRVMRENDDHSGIHQIGHVVLTPNEADALEHDLAAALST